MRTTSSESLSALPYIVSEMQAEALLRIRRIRIRILANSKELPILIGSPNDKVSSSKGGR